MSQGALHELRPRTATELFDAALHLCVHTRSELPVLALLGASPLCAAGIWVAWQAVHGRATALGGLVVAAALVFRQLCQGAGGLAATRELEGNPLSAAAALRASLARLPSLIVCTAWLAFFQLVAFPLTLGLSVFFLSSQLVGPLLIADGQAHGWNFGKVARARLAGRGGAAAVLRIEQAGALVFMMVNLHGMVWLGLKLAHMLVGVDVTFIDEFTSLSHGFYDLCLFAVAQCLLDPVRCASGVLLLADARVRHEGFDLLAALRRLRDSSVARAAAVLLAVLAAGFARPAHAEESAGDPQAGSARSDERQDPVQALASLADELGELDDPEVRAGLERADALPKAERAKLVPLVRDLDALLDAEDDADADVELRTALDELGRLKPRAALADPRAAAQRILAQPEFQQAKSHAKAEAASADAGAETPSWWTRFWKWVGRMLKKLFENHHAEPVEPTDGLSINGSAAELITYALAGLAACVVLILAYRLLTGRSRARPTGAAGGAAGSDAAGGEELNALARPTWVWSQQADALAAEGRFREAIRSLYLALLSSLHRRGAIDYHPALSNSDYCDAFRGEPPELQPFRELTFRFDWGWYGHHGTDAEGYRAFKDLCGPFLSGADPGEASHA